MIRALLSLSPAVLGIVAAMLGSGLSLGAAKLWNDLWENPAIVRDATSRAEDACTIRTQDAAARAEAAERLKQQRANAEALRIYREALTASQRAVEEADTRISQEIAAYENQIALEGRTCRLTQRDLDWLHGNEPPGANGGR